MTLRLTLADVLEHGLEPYKDRRFFLDAHLYDVPSVLNATLWFIKNGWLGCEGVSVHLDRGFPIDPDLFKDGRFKLEVHPLYGDK